MVLEERVQDVVPTRLFGIKMQILLSYLDLFFFFYACDGDVGCLGESNRS